MEKRSSLLDDWQAKNAVSMEIKVIKCKIFEKYTKMVKDNIDYDVLISRHYLEKSMIDGMVNLIVETIISENDYIIISSTKFPKEAVKSRFSRLDISHIEYVLECMNHNTTNIKNIKKYLLAALYNAPTTIDSYYKARADSIMGTDIENMANSYMTEYFVTLYVPKANIVKDDEDYNMKLFVNGRDMSDNLGYFDEE